MSIKIHGCLQRDVHNLHVEHATVHTSMCVYTCCAKCTEFDHYVSGSDFEIWAKVRVALFCLKHVIFLKFDICIYYKPKSRATESQKL